MSEADYTEPSSSAPPDSGEQGGGGASGNRILIIALVAIAVIALCALCAVGGFAIYQLRSESEPTSTAVVVTSAPTGAAPTDDSWAQIQAAGKIVVGTSADYPPYEYVTGEYQIDGFDIALMDEMGRRLGIQVEYKDFAFDGLLGALQIGQVDSAIAALAIIPEREAVVEFSNVYFVTMDAFLAQADSEVTSITSIEQVANSRVGTQRGSIYEGWLQSTLVDSGLMPASNLYSYAKIEDALRDLRENRLDLVVLDSQPAELAVEQGGVKLVGQGLNQQLLGIAFQKGALSLKAQMDQVMLDMHNEGYIAQLAKQYMDVDVLLPTPVPPPPPAVTATPSPEGCIDGLEFVEHLNYDDNNMTSPPEMSPGQPFDKSWRVKNTGTCTWNSSYTLVYAGGNTSASSMGGQPQPVQGEVAPGATYDVVQRLVAPAQPGTYQGYWQMTNSYGTAFGEKLPVGIVVLAGPTPTPAPTQTPVPGIEFTVDRDHIRAGECVLFSWATQNVKEVYFYHDGQNWQDHGVAGVAQSQECPPHTLTYYLRVVMADNSVVTRQITIYVEASPDAPYIKRFTVDPPNQITVGQCVGIRWNVLGDVDTVTLSVNGNPLWENAPAKGETQDCPSNTGVHGYAIVAVGPGGTSQQQQNVNVVGESTATPAPTAAPDLPVVTAFSVSPKQIATGECVNITWGTGGGTSWVNVVRDDDIIWDNAPLQGQVQDCPSSAGTFNYAVIASNPQDQTDRRDETVEVGDAPPENPLAGTRWNVAQLNGEAVLPDTFLTANFGQGGDLNGHGGCNSYSAGYTVNGDSLSIGGISASQKQCEDPPGVMEQEMAFIDALSSATSFSMEAGQLYIQNAGGVLEFVDSGP